MVVIELGVPHIDPRCYVNRQLQMAEKVKINLIHLQPTWYRLYTISPLMYPSICNVPINMQCTHLKFTSAY